jgi:hypothetical protein
MRPARWIAACWTAFALAACSPPSGTGRDAGVDDADDDGDGDGDAMPDADASPDAASDASPDADGGLDADGGTDGDTGSDGDIEPARECVDEACSDGLDNDCDGVVDEGCPCDPGAVAACFRGDPRHRGLGECRDGEMVCTGTYEFGEWGPCADDVTERAETCDPAGRDEDCDGAPNDGCECIEGDPDVACGTDVGACETGTQHCQDGRWTECEGARGPVIEVCNGADDDCDGAIDEGLVRGCGSDVGACRPGTETCADGAWGECLGGNPPTDEVCDSLDNDCDGDADEDVTRSCGSDTGRCVAGSETCVDGVFGPCEGSVGPTGETCNGVDDDCDGATDEGLTRSCGIGLGICERGIETCGDAGWGACDGATWPGLEVCDGVDDEDCDGTVDEGCECTSGDVRACGTGVGVCEPGSQTCGEDGTWSACEGSIEPAAESCDGEDNDCDGETDEGCECITGRTRSCGTSVGLCEEGIETCDESGRWGPCSGGVTATDEVCNREDDDCDGETDEGDVCPRFPPTVTCPGDVVVLEGEAVLLVGDGSDPDGGEVSFAWSVASRPVGSLAAPDPADEAVSELTPDVVGDTVLRLCVTDDEGETRCCTVRITATPRCVPPDRPVLTTCEVSWDRRPVVELTPLPAGVTYQLFVDGVAEAYALIDLVGQNYHRPPLELGAGGPPPAGEPIEIFARACRTDDPTCCSVSAPAGVALIEACDTPIAPTSANLVFSEYVTNGDGACPGPACEAGEAIEITNLSHCPVALGGHHFGYCNDRCAAFRWMNFGARDVIPPRGVYVAIRNRDLSSCDYPFFGPDDPGLFGLRISTLAMEGSSLASGWFNNAGGGSSVLRIATGAWVSIVGGETLEIVSPYSGAAGECQSIGFNAIDECGNISAFAAPDETLSPNQLGRLWHPCDAVRDPFPEGCM